MGMRNASKFVLAVFGYGANYKLAPTAIYKPRSGKGPFYL